MKAYNVYLNGKLIDTVFFNKTCDSQYVKDSLISHDGYDYRIIVKKAKKHANKQHNSKNPQQ